jgi:hypothetical protein
MEDLLIFPRPETKIKTISKLAVISVIIVGAGILGYYLGLKLWKISPGILQQLPAQILKPITGEKITEIVRETPEIPLSSAIPLTEGEKYLEIAESGEGITHLARRALKEYLQEKPQDFQVTPEHKVYIEDYIAKKLGGGWLKLGEKLEISDNLIKEAIEKAGTLTPIQLENLTRYSQLVPALNY